MSGKARLSIRTWRAFFFQAEDGIRDWSVTGVQTCALPISWRCLGSSCLGHSVPDYGRGSALGMRHRSEERRVGKECRSRWAPNQEKKKTFTGPPQAWRVLIHNKPWARA